MCANKSQTAEKDNSKMSALQSIVFKVIDRSDDLRIMTPLGDCMLECALCASAISLAFHVNIQY